MTDAMTRICTSPNGPKPMEKKPSQSGYTYFIIPWMSSQGIRILKQNFDMVQVNGISYAKVFIEFLFADQWTDTVDNALQVVKAIISKVPLEPEEIVQTDWLHQLSNALECYDVQVEDDDDDQRNINIPEKEGSREVCGPEIKDPDITVPLKTKQVNIGMKEEPKYATLGDYWDDATMEKVIDLVREYQDLFSTKITELKVILGDLGVMKITLKSDAKLVKKRPYQLNPK